MGHGCCSGIQCENCSNMLLGGCKKLSHGKPIDKESRAKITKALKEGFEQIENSVALKVAEQKATQNYPKLMEAVGAKIRDDTEVYAQ